MYVGLYVLVQSALLLPYGKRSSVAAPNVLSTFGWRLCNVVLEIPHLPLLLSEERQETLLNGLERFWERMRKSSMEHDNGDNHNWPVQRREEGLVNKHMADIARESLQQRLCAGEMHSLTERGSRRSGEEFTDEPRRRDVSFGEEPPLSTACSSGADKLLSAPPSTGHSLRIAKPWNSFVLYLWQQFILSSKYYFCYSFIHLLYFKV